MDKGCKTCALNGILAYRNMCKDCVASGTFSGWEPASCKGCAYEPHGKLYEFGSVTPCVDCQRHFPKSDVDYYEAKVIADPVNHPTHYTSGCGFECIEMMEMVFGKEAVHDFCTLNAFKYLWRHRQKGGADDIGKAKWYLEYTKGLGIFKNRQAIDKMKEHISKEEANK